MQELRRIFRTILNAIVATHELETVSEIFVIGKFLELNWRILKYTKTTKPI